MRLEWLEDILAVAETGSFAEAAERRRLTPSAFSRRIQNIEDYVGVRLFDRERKPVQLRPTTREQRDHIARLAGTLRQLLLDLRRGERQAANRIVIASQHALTTAMTPALIQGMRRRVGDFFVRLRSANLDDCFGLLLSRQADVALVYRAADAGHPIKADYVETLVIGADRLVPVIAPGAAAELSGTELPVIAYPAEVFLGELMERAVLPHLPDGMRAVPRVETALTLAAMELAAAGIGVAWVPASLAMRSVAEGRLRDLGGSLPGCALEVTAVRLAGNPSAIEREVWDHLAGLGAAAAQG